MISNGKKRKLFLIIAIISSIIMLTGGTAAYWYWSNIDDAKNLVINVAGLRSSDITYIEGESHIVGDFSPKNAFYDSVSTTVKFKKSSRVKDYPLFATLHLDVNVIGENMKEADNIYWLVTSGTSDISDSCSATITSDVNSDGKINTNDLLIIYNYATKDGIKNGERLYGDVTGNVVNDVHYPDGKLNEDDVDVSLWYSLNPSNYNLSSESLINLDVNLDGIITNKDVVYIQNMVENAPSLTDTIPDGYGDIDMDGKITTYDYARLAKYLSDKETNSLCDLSSNNVLNYGTFKGVSSGETINMLENIEVTTEEQIFTVWIWIDSNGGEIANLSGETIDTNMWTEILLYNVTETGNPPVLDKGMIPVTIANDGTVTTVSASDPEWYDYTEQKWANVVLVNENATDGVENSHSRTYYKSNIGTEVTQDDILAYYVWIPRYKYKMPQTKCSSIKNPTMEANPECYAPYTLTDDEKNALIKYRSDDALCEELYEEDQINAESTKDIELGLSTGRLSDGTSIVSYVEEYNNNYLENEGNTPCMWEGLDVSEITLTSSDFNGNIMFTTKEETIDISFESSSESMSLGNAKTEYRTHPAFWWNHDNDTIVDTGETVPGIWVGKFETTPDKSSTCYTTANSSNCNNATQNATILPNTVSLRFQTVSNQFATSQNFSKSGNIYGLSNSNTNAHMMKNSEWGAVAYLSHSVYGINEEIYINNNSKYYTGRSGGSTSASSSTYGTYTWLGETLDTSGNIGAYAADRTYGTNASTTGNVTGIYDMSGGTWEYVMGHYGDTVYIVEDMGIGDYSEFEELPESKYYDLYSEEDFPGTYYGNLAYCTIDLCGGHALNETAGWYNDYAYFVDWGIPWFIRGGNYGDGQYAGAFTLRGNNGYAATDSWRSVVVPGFGA